MTNLPPHERKILETICADECERLNPQNPFALAFSWSQMLLAIRYAEKFCKDFDTLINEPVTYSRGMKMAELINGLEVVVAIALQKVTGQPMVLSTTTEEERHEIQAKNRLQVWKLGNGLLK